MTTQEFRDRLLRFRGLIRLACSDASHAAQYALEAEALRHELMLMYARAVRCAEHVMSDVETGSYSATTAADSDAWELSRLHCTCRDCKGRDNLPRDALGDSLNLLALAQQAMEVTE